MNVLFPLVPSKALSGLCAESLSSSIALLSMEFLPAPTMILQSCYVSRRVLLALVQDDTSGTFSLPTLHLFSLSASAQRQELDWDAACMELITPSSGGLEHITLLATKTTP